MAANDGRTQKPTFLVLGGSGFIGRNFVDFLIKNDLVSKVRVVDKVPPQTAWFNKNHQEVFKDPRVEFRSANLISPSSCQSVFDGSQDDFQYVVNFAAETKCGQTDPVYKEGTFVLSVNCAKEAARCNVQRYIEMSSSQMYSNGKRPAKECDDTDPWTPMARFKLQVEDDLRQINGLDYVIVRPAIVYGIGDKNGLVPRLIIGGVYKCLGEMMKLLWTRDIQMNTVHVTDLCRAIWHLCRHGKTGQVYHVVDKGNTIQGKLSDLVSEIFDINHDYVGTVLSTLAKADMASVVNDINEKHLSPWADACARDGIENTPLNPYLDQELLYNRHLHLDGSKLEATGFDHLFPEVTKELLLQILHDYIEMGIFPASILQ